MSDEELIFGKNAVLAFLEQQGEPGRETSGACQVSKILCAQGLRGDGRLESIYSLSRALRIPLHLVDRRKLDQLAGRDKRHQGVVAIIAAAELWTMERLLDRLRQDRLDRERSGQSMDGYMIAIADGMEDPHNLGAIVRVGAAAGVNALILTGRRSAGITGTVAKVSAGALASLPIVRVTNLVQAIETLKQHGFWVVGLAASGARAYTQVDLKRPLAVVVGSEARGMGRLVGEQCDFVVKIPMLGKVESLNAAVAAGVFFYEVVRQCRG